MKSHFLVQAFFLNFFKKHFQQVSEVIPSFNRLHIIYNSYRKTSLELDVTRTVWEETDGLRKARDSYLARDYVDAIISCIMCYLTL